MEGGSCVCAQTCSLNDDIVQNRRMVRPGSVPSVSVWYRSCLAGLNLCPGLRKVLLSMHKLPLRVTPQSTFCANRRFL